MSAEKKPSIEELRAAKAAREAAAAEKKAADEYLELELSDRFSREGAEGVDFRIVRTLAGPIVLKLGPSILWKAYFKSKNEEADLANFVLQQVAYPEKSAYLAIVNKHEGLIVALENVLSRMHMGADMVTAGK